MNCHYLHIINTLDTRFGGPPIVVTSLVKEQKKLGNKVTIITTYLNHQELKTVNTEFNYLIKNGIELILFPAFTFYRISFQFIKLLFNTEKNTIFYFHGLYRWPTTIGAFICRIKNNNYVIRVHGSLDPYLFKKSVKGKKFYFLKKISEKFFDLRNLKKAMWVHLTSQNELIKLPNYLKKNCRLEIIPNGISVPDIDEYIDIKRRYKLSNDQKILLYLGRINEKKGLDILIKSFPFVFKRIKNISLLIIGPDNEDYVKKLETLLKNMDSDISKNIILENKKISRSHIKSYFTQSDLFILPSHSENFGMSVIESIYFGTPTLISKNVDIFNDLKNKKLVNIIDELRPENLSNAIFESLKDQELKKSVKEFGRSKIKSIYSWEKIAYDIDKLKDKYLSY